MRDYEKKKSGDRERDSSPSVLHTTISSSRAYRSGMGRIGRRNELELVGDEVGDEEISIAFDWNISKGMREPVERTALLTKHLRCGSNRRRSSG